MYVAGIIAYAFGVCLMAQANIGISAITSVAYLFTILTPASLGTTQLIWNIALIALQVLWLRKNFDKIQYMQIVASFIFSVFIDLLMPVAKLFVLTALYQQVILFLVSGLVMGVGLSTMVAADLVIIPGDGMAKTIAKKTGWQFGKAKVVTDLSCVLITCVISFAVLHRLAVVQVGTVLAALLIGNVARVYGDFTYMRLFRFMRMETPGTENE